MRRTGIFLILLTVLILASCRIGSSPAQAAEVLLNGNFESSVSPVGWSLTTSVTGAPGVTVPSAVEHNDGSNNPPTAGLGLLLHPQAGNTGVFVGQDRKVNLVLEETFVGAVPGRIFTFKGDANLQNGYSGIVDTLNEFHPRGDFNNNFVNDLGDYTTWRNHLGEEIALPNEGVTPGMVTQEDFTEWKTNFGHIGHAAGPSPTVTTFEIAFLTSSDVVLGDPVVFDLRDDPTTLAWRTNSVMGLAPATTNKVRVRVSALDMIDNCCAAGQDVLFDNFSLKDNGQFSSTIERLANGNLNLPGDPQGWTQVEGPMGMATGTGELVTADSIAYIGFANHAAGGQQGVWLRPFVNVTQFDPDLISVDGVVTQTVDGTADAEYTFSAWAAWENGYGGGLAGTSTQTLLKMEFLNSASSVIDTQTLDLLAAGMVNDDNSGPNPNGGNIEPDDWRQFSLNAVAPAGTVGVRVSVGAIGMFDSGLGFQSGFFDDLSLMETLPGAGGLAAVPEPVSVVLLAIALGMIGVGRRRS